MTETPRETRVLDAVVSLVDTLLDDFDVVDLMTELTEHCAQLLDVAAAGFLLADPFDQLRLLAATTEEARELELFQLQADEGPCVDCYATGQPVSVADLNAAAARWPRFVPAALDAGFASVHAVPMRAAGIVLGALGLFGTDTGELDDADRLVAQTLAHIACVAILQEHAPTPATVMPQLRSALASRVIVEQAKGLLRETLDISVEDAFTYMRSYARANGEHLTDVARRLMTRSAHPLRTGRRHLRIRHGATAIGTMPCPGARCRPTERDWPRSCMVTRLSVADAMVLHTQTSTTPAHTVAFVILEASDHLSHDRLQQLVASSLPQMARFRSRLVDKPFGVGVPVWAEIDGYDPSRQIHSATVPAPGGRRELADVVTRLGAEPHDWRRSLWEAWSIDGLAGGRWALAVKMSPVLSAGSGRKAMWERLLTSGPHHEWAGNRPTEPSLGPAPSVGELVTDTLAEIVENYVTGGWLIADAVTGVMQAARRRLRDTDEVPLAESPAASSMSGPVPHTVFNAPLTKRRAIAIASIPLADVKTISDAFGGNTANVLFASLHTFPTRVAAAVRRRPRRSPADAGPALVAGRRSCRGWKIIDDRAGSPPGSAHRSDSGSHQPPHRHRTAEHRLRPEHRKDRSDS